MSTEEPLVEKVNVTSSPQSWANATGPEGAEPD